MGINVRFKAISIGTTINATIIETFGLPLAVIIVVIMTNTERSVNPKITMLREGAAFMYLAV